MAHTSGCVRFVVDVSRGAETPGSLSSIAKGWDSLLLLSKVANKSDCKNMARGEVMGVLEVDVGENELTVSSCCSLMSEISISCLFPKF